MPQRCRVCYSTDRGKIDRALVGQEGSVRAIAKKFGVSRQSLDRHRLSHLPRVLVTASQAHENTRADDLMTKAEALEIDARRLLAKAESLGELRTSVAAVRELTRIVELFAKLNGLLKEPQFNVNVNVTPELAERVIATFASRRLLAPKADDSAIEVSR